MPSDTPGTPEAVEVARNWWAGQIVLHNFQDLEACRAGECEWCEAVHRTGVIIRTYDSLVARIAELEGENERLRELQERSRAAGDARRGTE